MENELIAQRIQAIIQSESELLREYKAVKAIIDDAQKRKDALYEKLSSLTLERVNLENALKR